MNFSGDNSTYLAVKENVVDNLSSMGVEASMDDGMTTLANKILDVEPTIVVDNFDMDLTLSANSTSVFVGDTVTLSAHLTASYDTEEVDLTGDLQNATVSFYENNTLLGSSTTNSSGVATYNYTTVNDTDLTFTASFDGTENFDDAESNTVNVSVDEMPEFTDDNYLEFIVHGSSVSISGGLAYDTAYATNSVIDYGDGTIERNSTGIDFGRWGTYTYEESGTYLVKIYTENPSIPIQFGSNNMAFSDSVVAVKFTNVALNWDDPIVFKNCTKLKDVQLYWTGNNIRTYSTNLFPNNDDLIFTIPNGTTSDYVAKGYPSNKLVERSA